MSAPAIVDVWAGLVPSPWRVEPLGAHAWIRARLGWKGLTADEYVDEGIPMLSTPEIKGQQIAYENANRITQQRYDESPEIKLANGDVLLTKDGSTIGIVNVVRDLPEPATVNGSIAVISTADTLDPQFLYWLLASAPSQQVMSGLKDGMGVPHLFQRDIRRMRLPVPGVLEQRAIAGFLDRETVQIDEFIAENERFIELLTERRAAAWDLLYARARQEGPFLPLARGLKSIVDGPFGSSLTSAHYTDEGTRVIRLGNIGINEFRDADVAYIDNEYAHQLRAHEARPGDVIIAGLGDERMPLGRACALPDIGPAIVKADCYRARPNERLESRYLAWVLSAPASGGLMNLEARGATRARLNTEVVKRVRIPMPSIELQRELVAAHSERTARIDEAIATAREGISLAKERRSALISAAVTGKIDVGSGS